MTSRMLAVRVSEHAGKSCRTGRHLACPPHSAIREHAEQCDVPISLNSFRVLDKCKDFYSLRILESLHIFKLKPVLNNQNSSFPLCVVCN